VSTVAVAAALLACAVLGTTVVLVRDPLRQSMVSGVFGVGLVAAFVLFQAPDVALSAVVVAGAAAPLMTLLALASVRAGRTRGRDR
jgi:uncharacterized MnhB-related membrane protein